MVPYLRTNQTEKEPAHGQRFHTYRPGLAERRRAPHCRSHRRGRNSLSRIHRTRRLRTRSTEAAMTSPVTQTFRAAFDVALDEFITTLKEAQDYLGGGNDLAAIADSRNAVARRI